MFISEQEATWQETMAEEDPFGFEPTGEAQEDMQDPFFQGGEEEEEAAAAADGFEDDAFGEPQGAEDDDAFGEDGAAEEEEVDGTQEALGGEYDTLQDEGLGEAVEETAQPVADPLELPVESAPAAEAAPVEEEQDDAALRAFEKSWKATLDAKDAKDEAERTAMREAAAKELVEFAEANAAKLQARAKTNREEEAELISRIDDALTAENPWERISMLVDVSGTSESNERDVSRLRGLLLQLKSAPIESK